MKFCITGTFQDEDFIEATIINAGHKVCGLMTSDVDFLIVGKVQPANRRVTKAKLLKSEIVPVDDLKNLLTGLAVGKINEKCVSGSGVKKINPVTIAVPLETLQQWQEDVAFCITPNVPFLPDRYEDMKELADKKRLENLEKLMKSINQQVNNIMGMKTNVK